MKKDIYDKIEEFIKDKENNKILENNKNYNISFNKNKEILITLKEKKILVGDFNFWGIYQLSTKLWIWASSIPGVNKKHIKNINEIKKSNYIFENDNSDNGQFYYQLLTQDVIYLDNPSEQIKMINMLLLYLSNDIYFLNPSNNLNNTQFMTLSKINQKFV
jgi:hypothetical protein